MTTAPPSQPPPPSPPAQTVPARLLPLAVLLAGTYIGAQMLADIASLKIGIVARLAVDMGTFIYPITFTLRDLVHKALGKRAAQVLVVTRLEPGATCHVAYVDATANENANEMAREAADDLARDFDCEDEPEIVGAFEAWDVD